MDKIFIKNLHAHGILGVNPHERVTPQPILINIAIELDTHTAAEADDLSHSVSYSDLARKVKTHTETAHRLTVEALAADIARICLAEPGVQKATVRVEKPEAVPEAETVGVEIERTRQS
jgi:FolB domain-containing protein